MNRHHHGGGGGGGPASVVEVVDGDVVVVGFTVVEVVDVEVDVEVDVVDEFGEVSPPVHRGTTA